MSARPDPLRKLLVSAALGVLLVACGAEDRPSGTIETAEIAAAPPVVDGSTSTHPLRMFVMCSILDVSCAWEQLFDGSRRVLPAVDASPEVLNRAVPSTGTHGSYVALIEGRADLILVARKPSREELLLAESRGVEMDISAIALDAFVFLVHADNPVSVLSLDEVRGIFSGAVGSWAEVGGNARPIQPYQRNETSGSQVLMETLVMRGLPMIDAPNMILPTMMAPFDAISRDPDGIGYSVYYYATHMLAAAEFRLLELEGIAPGPETIASGEYPLVTDVYAVLRRASAAGSTARMLADWLATDAGRAVIEESGYVPLP